MNKLLLSIIIGLFAFPLISAAPTCADYNCSMFLWYPLGFIALMIFMLYSLVNIIGRLSTMEVDLTDVTKSLCGYLGFLFFYYFCTTYFADAFMLDMMDTFMYPFGFTHLLLPLIAIVFTWIKKRKVE